MPGAGTDRTRTPIEGGPVVVLVEPQLPENVGMTARAMANFGLPELRLVRPRAHWLNDKARGAAAGAVHLLERATVYPDVPAAIADLRYVLATTARERGQAKPVLLPEEAARELRARDARAERLGLLFGRERTGLENDDVALADAVVTFPVNPAHASLNLAQAVLLMGYAWMAAGPAPPPAAAPERSPPARRDMVLSFFDYLEGELEAAGFFRPDHKAPVMRRNLRNILHRLQLTEQDVRTLRGVVVRLVEGPRRPRSKRADPPQG